VRVAYLQALRVDELAQQVSGVQDKIAFFEENLQSQHHFLEKMDNRTLESFAEVISQLIQTKSPFSIEKNLTQVCSFLGEIEAQKAGGL
jgi:hypothetical protein